MFKGKSMGIMRHPYATLTIIGLATAGALSIASRVKTMLQGKMKTMENGSV